MYTYTFLDKFSKYKKGDIERNFILQILEANPKYESYKYRYLEYANKDVKKYNEELEKALKDAIDEEDLYYRNTEYDEIIEEDYIEDIVKDIDCMIEAFKKQLLPPMELDSVLEEFSNIFENVVAESKGFLKDENGKWHKFGEDSHLDVELLCLKNPYFNDSMQDEDHREMFIDYLENSYDECLDIYDEKEMIKNWY